MDLSGDSSLISGIKMQMIFRILEDKKLHSTKEIATIAGVSEENILAFLRFLATYFIVTCDKEQRTVMIKEDFLNLT